MLLRFLEARVEQKVYLYFDLKSHPIRALGTVRNVRSGTSKTCLGIKFENLSKADEDYIRKFIIEEQRELLRAYKMGELKEDFSSSEP